MDSSTSTNPLNDIFAMPPLPSTSSSSSLASASSCVVEIPAPSVKTLASSSTLTLHATASPTRPPLRSCLSPSRSSSGCPTPERVPSSRTTSFSSEASCGTSWRRAKSVRWEGENEGCAVTSYHPTWSALEYDRSPLEPPSEAERTCVLPERGSRCLRPTIDCFSSVILDELCESPQDESDTSRDLIITPLISEDVSLEECSSTDVSDAEDCPDDEDREWEACMERRRLMFAMRAEQKEDDRQPEFEGYRSLSATLVELLRTVGCEDGPVTPSQHLLSEHNLGGQLEITGTAHPVTPIPLGVDSEPIIPTPSLLSSASSEDDSVVICSPAQRSPLRMVSVPILIGPMTKVDAGVALCEDQPPGDNMIDGVVVAIQQG